MNNKETVKTGSKEAKEQEVEQKRRTSRIVEVERHRSTKTEKQGKLRSVRAKKQGKQKTRK